MTRAIPWPFILILTACTIAPTTPEKAPIEETPAPRLSWEEYPENRPWSAYTFKVVKEVLPQLDKAKDVTEICPKYASLTDDQKAAMWSEFISAVAYPESGWDATSRMTETTMGTDPVTGKQVASEGLLQLSYQDVRTYPFCKFDWSKDKSLAPKDPKKTILDPYINLDCGIRIMAQIAEKRGGVMFSENVYWSVLKRGGKYSKIDSIIARVRKNQPKCN